MKRTLYYLLMLLLCAALLCGCASTKNAQPTPEPTATVSPTSPPTPTPEPTPTPGLPDQSEYAQAYLNVIDRYLAEYADNPYVELTYDLIDFDGDEVPELVIDDYGYWVSMFTYAGGTLYTVMDQWAYGAMGNYGYEYLPGQNVLRNYNADGAGAIMWTSFEKIGSSHEMESYYEQSLSQWMFKDKNHNYLQDEDEPYEEDAFYYYGEQEITEQEFTSYLIPGDYRLINGTKTYDEIVKMLMDA